MADTGIFATTAEVQRKVHVDASAISNVEAYINQYMAEAESTINSDVSHNFSDDYAALDADVKSILKMAATELAALDVESYDINSIGRSTAIHSANKHLEKYDRAITILRNKRKQGFVKNA